MYDLERFVQDMDRLVAGPVDDVPALVKRVAPLVRELVSDMSWLDEQYATSQGGLTLYNLHSDPEDRYSVISVVFDVGYVTPVHDHGTWGVVGIWRGEEREERFRRVDDGATPGYAKLQLAGDVVNGPGAVGWVIPPDQEVHRVSTASPTPAYSIHVYGRDLSKVARRAFDLETGVVTEFNPAIR